MEPAASEPSAIVPMPPASDAEAPPLDPPGVFSGFQGLRVIPHNSDLVKCAAPNSGTVVLPRRTAPASRMRATDGESSSQGPRALIARLPRRVGQPRVTDRSFTVVGTPSSGLRFSPRRHRSSLARADSSAAFASSQQNALRTGLSDSICASTARAASTGEALRERYSADSSLAESSARFSTIEVSCSDVRRLCRRGAAHSRR